MKKLLITSVLILASLISYSQDFVGKDKYEVERVAKENNFRITKGTLQGMQQQGFNLNYADWCYHWVLVNNNKVIEVAFHPSTGEVFLQTISLQRYILK